MDLCNQLCLSILPSIRLSRQLSYLCFHHFNNNYNNDFISIELFHVKHAQLR